MRTRGEDSGYKRSKDDPVEAHVLDTRVRRGVVLHIALRGV
jgi:hypothetical protein